MTPDDTTKTHDLPLYEGRAVNTSRPEGNKPIEDTTEAHNPPKSSEHAHLNSYIPRAYDTETS